MIVLHLMPVINKIAPNSFRKQIFIFSFPFCVWQTEIMKTEMERMKSRLPMEMLSMKRLVVIWKCLY